NAGSDYIHHSDSWLGSNAGIGNSQVPGALLQAWVNADRAQGLKTIITLPLAGYVAADMNGTVTPEQTAPSFRWKQVIADKPGALSLNPDTADGAVYIEEMVNFLLHHYGSAADGGVSGFSLDNEPGLWSETHPRIHPSKVSYQELVNRHVPVATVTTALDPSAQIYGPVSYGWGEHLDLQQAPDAAHFNSTYGNFTNYYLAQMKSASDAAGRRLLHYYDVHWYPEARGDNRIVFGTSPGTNNDIDARLHAPRSLWDPSYIETSWITQWTTNGQGIRLLPRLQEAVDQYYPGTGLAITEYNYGASDHISGGVAIADVLGIFGRYQVAGCFWPLQSNNSYVAAAFQLYRNYDGAGAKFGTISLEALASDNAKAAVHAARTTGGKLTVLVTNRSRTLARTAAFQISVAAGRTLNALKAYRLTSAGAQVQAVANPPALTGNNFSDTLAAMSASLYELQINVADFTAWQEEQFGDGASNPAIAGPTADPDRDGVANLLEYVTRRDPKSPESTAPLRVNFV
ncbi:MAG TPA: glycoside hydrolase family 44 protein, partial [Chthoniobacterales bacterium]|nr:glycoside hydrolase family 44 protein [Chthoniobacterales bacterium]